MISFDEALGWLNRFDVTHVVGALMEARLREIGNPALPLDSLKELAGDALLTARASPDLRMAPEVMLRIAQAFYKRGDLPTAETHAQNAAAIYRGLVETHREATALYLLSIIQSAMSYKNDQAGQNRLAAINKFSQMANDPLYGSAGDAYDWYIAVLGRINVEQVAFFDTASGWLTLFDDKPTRLQASSQALRDQVVAAVRAVNYPLARSRINLLISVSTSSDDRLELPEALVVAAKAEFDMGNPEKARELLREAISKYRPSSHAQAVSRWLLGCVTWQLPGGKADGLQNWRQAIATFQELANRADKKNDQDQRGWYMLRSAEMQAALEQRLADSGQ
jgi:tetratricopeptide (TPR) repeat protein